MAAPTLEPLGDTALLLRWNDGDPTAANRQVHAIARRLRESRAAWLVDCVPALASLAVFFDAAALPGADPAGAVEAQVGALLAAPVAQTRDTSSRLVEIPVCYGGEHGPDLDAIAATCGMSATEVIARHAGPEYLVAMLGFSPGFPYLLGLDSALAVPRLATPRVRVPAGSVGIGGSLTGVYPDEGPGGWRLLGRTPRPMFDAARDPPAWVAPGDRVRFVRVEADSFAAMASDGESRRVATFSAPIGIEVLAAGLQTTVQDLGRFGHRHLGVGVAGALDAHSARVANLLVGNAGHAALFEIALHGPRLRFAHATRIALAGADIDAHADGVALPGWRPIDLPAGCELVLGRCRRGARAYLAVAGGVRVDAVLGSAGTDLRAGFGGLGGRCLVAGDVLASPHEIEVRQIAIAPWWIDPTPDLDLAHPQSIRVLRGHDAVAPQDALCTQAWRVTARSNRQGLRLEGDALALAQPGERGSEPVAPGTVQLPPDGQPIVLLGEAQTIGGYPRIGHVIAADLPRLAQRRPGDAVRFDWVDAAAAHAAACAQRQRLARIALAIGQRRGR